jgi:DNA-binding NtrC family response regulator
MPEFVETNQFDLLLVDDDEDFRSLTARNFRKRSYAVRQADSGEAALKLLKKRAFDVAIVDLSMPGMSGIDLLGILKQSGANTEVVMLTGEATIRTAVEAIKLGAHDYLTKPVQMDELVVVVQKACEAGRLRQENRQLKAVLQRSQPLFEMIGDSPAMQEVFRLIGKAGPTDKPILIQGESGTGKELVARALHGRSQLADQPLVVINCAALSEHLLESELFGHEKGSFTGAVAAKPGLFEVADKGTLFIDEIGEMAGSLQAKLLRVLEDGSLRRVGSLTERRVKVRLITATNRGIQEEVAAGRFREDLYYRIDVMTLRLPPLRERAGDIPLLARHFAGPEWRIAPDAMQASENYHWPGNVRQLINAIERAKILADEETICLQNLPPAVAQYADKVIPGKTDLGSLQKSHVAEIMQRENGNKARAARALGISRRALYRLLDKHGISNE